MGGRLSRRGGRIGSAPRIVRTLIGAFSATALAGCLWIPGLFPEKLDPPAPSPDTRNFSHCQPYPGRPVLLGHTTGPRTFQCRVLDPTTATWSISFADPVQSSLPPPAVNGYVLAEGVKSVTLNRDDLPFSPHGYEAVLRLTIGSAETRQDWRIFVLPHADAAWPTPDPETEG